MFLSKLEILGFKSFQQRTVVTFNRGLNSIVGPNGCGKTNIVDAIRWCLGEQKSSKLRSDKMENVIFNGTSQRKPMGMAEVSLTIQNDRGALPSDYTEVVITRRIFRSGESEYLLNKNICRLKDITNLFMDTGMGTNAYSVIELKMVESILSSKTEERRTMFEEAAGVNKYKLRRRLTLKKLDDVKADLNRVNDIVSEVQKKVNSLSRQAKKADKAKELTGELKEIDHDYSERLYALLLTRKEEWKQRKEDSITERRRVEKDLGEIEEQLEGIKDTLLHTEAELNSKRNQVAALVERMHKSEQSISVSEEARRSLERNIARYTQELDELRDQLEATEEAIEEYQFRIQEVGGEVNEKLRQKNTLTEQVEQQKQVVSEKRATLKEFNDLQLDKFKEITGRKNQLTNLDDSLARVNNTIGADNKKIQELTGDIAKTVGYIEELSNDKADVEKKLHAAEEEHRNKQTEKEKLEKELNQLRANDLEEKSIVKDITSRINFLSNLIENLEGFSRGTKSLLENKEWSSGEVSLLADIGDSKEEYRFAVEAALKNNLNTILVDSLEEIRSAIDKLKNQNAGKAAFQLLRSANGKKSFTGRVEDFLHTRKRKKLVGEPGFLGWAHEFIEADDRWNAYLKSLLGNTALFESLEQALALYGSYPAFTFVTLDGDYIESGGVIEAGALPQLDDTMFGRRQLLNDLEKELPERENNLKHLETAINSKERALEAIDLKELAKNERILVNDLANVEKQLSQAEYEKEKAADEIEKIRKEIQELVTQANRLEQERGDFAASIAEEEKAKEEADRKQQQLEEEFNAAQEEFNRVTGEYNSVNLSLERLAGEKKNLENQLQRAQESITSINRGIDKRDEDIKDSQLEIERLNEVMEEHKENLEDITLHKNEAMKEEEEINEAYKKIRSEISEYEKQQRERRAERDSIGETVHKADIELNSISIRINNLLDSFDHKYNQELQRKDFDDLDLFDFKGRESEIKALENKLSQLGPVNLLAYDEYEEEKERLEFLMNQHNDLIESEKDLIKTIDEINETAQQLFFDTFEEIRHNFIKIFRSLFDPGDEADLKLEEGVDPLEAKIEIVAKPKGKRPTSIELLSGGEKTLTAIALLFAIYLVKPSPFCILDEIDAPLDDANIDRFTKILRDFSEKTQFIVVTHNKRTMEAADILYGVTMQEEGVSKLVSVKFDDDLTFVA